MRKKFNIIIFSIVISLVLIPNIKAAYNPYEKAGPYGTNCTWYAWQKAYEIGGVALAAFGNAKEWYNDAKNNGYSVGTSPQSNSIIVWGDWTEYGHVGYVESVSGDTMYIWDSSSTCSIETEEYNACINADAEAGMLHQGTYSKCEPLKKSTPCEYKVNDRYTTGYIYLNEPRQTPSYNNYYNAPVEDTKSSNNYLSELNINELEIDFDKEKLEYSWEVGDELEEVTISAKTEDEKSKIEGTGNFSLKMGNNDFVIKVTAEDDSVKEYKISIIKKSSNNYLSELNISDFEIDFDKEKLEYSFEVENEIEKITISAKTEDEKSKIDGIGNFSLKAGENDFIIKVIAEDKSIKEYKISITRKEKVVEEKQDKNNDITSNNYVFFIGIGIALLILIVIIVIILHKKSKKKNDISKNDDIKNNDNNENTIEK